MNFATQFLQEVQQVTKRLDAEAVERQNGEEVGPAEQVVRTQGEGGTIHP